MGETMDSYSFKKTLEECQVISEETAYLEMFSYSDSSFDSIKQDTLTLAEYKNFLHRQNTFAPAILPDNVRLVAGLRLILQEDASHKDTFLPKHISMSIKNYSAMIEALHLPRMAIETSSVVGPFFWSALDRDNNGNTRLHMIFRKSDVMRQGKTKGWELILSHELITGITTGFCKGTSASIISESIKQLKACASELEHPVLLPLIIFGHESSLASDIRQRDARRWTQRLEHAVSMREGVLNDEGYFYGTGCVDLGTINRDLVECQAQELWKRPVSYLAIIDSIEEVGRLFIQLLPESRKTPVVENFQKRMTARLEFYRKRWVGIQTYADTTMRRLEIQRSALYAVMAQKESRLSLEIASDQKRLAHVSERESKAMKGISLLGTVFLPGTFLASIFSTTFFDFGNGPGMASVVSSKFWLYWAVTIPFTLVVVGLFFLWKKRRLRSYEIDDRQLEENIEQMEKLIMIRFTAKSHTWNNTWTERIERKAGLAADEENDYGAFKEPAVTVESSSNSESLAVPV
ncbi:hypothetical protein V8C35DRAFT_309481 [Trichoderma chlorosporum]